MHPECRDTSPSKLAPSRWSNLQAGHDLNALTLRGTRDAELKAEATPHPSSFKGM